MTDASLEFHFALTFDFPQQIRVSHKKYCKRLGDECFLVYSIYTKQSKNAMF